MKVAEMWKDIEGYEGKYQISNKGRVKSFYSNKILKPTLTQRGYIVNLTKEGKGKKYTVANLVGKHFLEKSDSDKDKIILHIGSITDDRIENLKYGTRKEQVQLMNRHRKDILYNYNLSYETYSKLVEKAKRNGVKRNTFNKRLFYGWTIEEATEIPVQRKVKRLDRKLFEYGGKLMSVKQVAEKYNLNKNCIYKRLKRGWTIEEIIEIPVAKNNK